MAGSHRGWMDVEASVSPSGAFSWNVLGEGGSERTREKVFRAVLAAEAEAIRLVEIEIPPGWRVRVIEGSEFQVRLAAIEAESDDDGDSNGVSPSQSKGP